MHAKHFQRTTTSLQFPERKAREAQAQDPSPKPTTLTFTFSEDLQSTSTTSTSTTTKKTSSPASVGLSSTFTTKRTLPPAFVGSSSTSATLPTRSIVSAMTTTPPVYTSVPADTVASPSFSAIASAPRPLPNGAVAGIVIACLIPIIICFFILWRRSRDKMKMRLWPTVKSNTDAGTSEKGPRLEGQEGVETDLTNFRGQVLYKETTVQNGVTIDVVKVQWPTTPSSAKGPALPPSIYAPDFNPSTSHRFSLPPRSAHSLTPSPTRPPSSSMPSVSTPVQGLYTVNIARTFIPSLSDELSITAGETLRVLKEFDDGWAQCERLFSGQVGMVPLECFDLDGKIPIDFNNGKAGSVFGKRISRVSAISAFGSVRSVSTGAATVGHGAERVSSKRYTAVKGVAV